MVPGERTRRAVGSSSEPRLAWERSVCLIRGQVGRFVGVLSIQDASRLIPLIRVLFVSYCGLLRMLSIDWTGMSKSSAAVTKATLTLEEMLGQPTQKGRLADEWPTKLNVGLNTGGGGLN